MLIDAIEEEDDVRSRTPAAIAKGLSFEHVALAYAGVPAVRGISLSVEDKLHVARTIDTDRKHPVEGQHAAPRHARPVSRVPRGTRFFEGGCCAIEPKQ